MDENEEGNEGQKSKLFEVKVSDVFGVGKALPKEAVVRLTHTACDTFEKVLAPITETTAGLGKFIKQKFETKTELEKMNLARVFQMGQAKVEATDNRRESPPSLKTLSNTIDAAALETEESLQELWANLLANQLTTETVHPAFPKILDQLSHEDAVALAKIQERGECRPRYVGIHGKPSPDLVDKATLMVFGNLNADDETFVNQHLAGLNLASKVDGRYYLTRFGEEFLNAVSSTEKNESDEPSV